MVASAQLTGAASASGDRVRANLAINTAAALQLCWLQAEQGRMTLCLAGFTANTSCIICIWIIAFPECF